MQPTIKKELPVIAIALIPFIYLAFVWSSLPPEVPLHWNASGEIDRYGGREELILIPFMLPVLVYLVFLVVPKIDPKNKLNQMGTKLHNIKLVLTLFMSLLATFIIYMAKNGTMADDNYILMFIGVLYIILGNYFKTIKANYFIGIRTPWTLENEAVWKATHKIGGQLWFAGGLVVVLACLLLNDSIVTTVFIAITAIIALVPVAYSYVKFKQITK